jgi:DUF1680 family protein
MKKKNRQKSRYRPKLSGLLIISLFILVWIFLFLEDCKRSKSPELIASKENWNPVSYRAFSPIQGVVLKDGLFKDAFDNNIAYLLESFTIDQMLKPFRMRAGKENPPGEPFPDGFWGGLPGSCAGRFLMGAGNTLRWVENEKLRQKMDALVEGIAECAQPNGYIMAYPENKITYSEYGNYVRSWLTQGLIEAGKAENPIAYRLIRDFQDWFNQCEYLEEMRNLKLGYQGMIANTRVYFSPVGKKEDIDVLLRYYEEDWWVDQLIAENKKAIWDRPKNTPHTHCYEVTALEAYLDVYRATGIKKYLDAVMGGWRMFHDYWLHPGGGFSITEHSYCPPRSYDLNFGELCCSVFWTFLNQRLHQLHPYKERYITEIEREIYNVGFGNQDGKNGIRYHARLHGRKMDAHEWGYNTCCEGQGTRLFGALPEFIYTIARDGIYINLYTPSQITWTIENQDITVSTATDFPFNENVEITVNTNNATRFKMFIRIPSWVSYDKTLDETSWLRGVGIRVNAQLPTTKVGQPGSYFVIDRKWRNGDVVTFRLPRDFRVLRYEGRDQIEGHQRFAIEYGPLLMAFVGPLDFKECIWIHHSPYDISRWMEQKQGQPLHFSIHGHPKYECMPYFEVKDQTFTCFPILEK